MKTSPMVRLLIMGVILMALNVPLTMMCGVVGERTARRNSVAAEVSSGAGQAHRLEHHGGIPLPGRDRPRRSRRLRTQGWRR